MILYLKLDFNLVKACNFVYSISYNYKLFEIKPKIFIY